ncbi:MAG: protoheme IX farnesyltransferase [Acidobacteria bacterium]|nr:MAG: protoheme IX farnesyltransferase [Acidobacteriota bacterium]
MDFVALAKPRLNFLVVASAMAGYAMAGMEGLGATRLLGTLAGTGLVAGGASALNQLLERDTDALMRRTRMRPLPDHRVQPREALVFGWALAAIGLLILAGTANLLAASVALATLLIYIGVYTPMKRLTSLATVVGAVPGALPPIIGWAAARDALSIEAWTLFGIVFLWQLPHFLAIAWMFRDDYTRAGFAMLPVLEPDGRSTARQALVYAAALVPVSLAPTLFRLTGALYFSGALILGVAFLWLTFRFARTRSMQDARRLFFGSIIYLPLVWILMIVDRL